MRALFARLVCPGLCSCGKVSKILDNCRMAVSRQPPWGGLANCNHHSLLKDQAIQEVVRLATPNISAACLAGPQEEIEDAGAEDGPLVTHDSSGATRGLEGLSIFLSSADGGESMLDAS